MNAPATNARDVASSALLCDLEAALGDVRRVERDIRHGNYGLATGSILDATMHIQKALVAVRRSSQSDAEFCDRSGGPSDV